MQVLRFRCFPSDAMIVALPSSTDTRDDGSMSMDRRLACISIALGVATTAAACSDSAGDAGFGGATDGLTGAGTGGADDGSGGSGGAAGGDESGGPPPEMEDEGDFRVPRASGRFVYSASESTDSVAVI